MIVTCDIVESAAASSNQMFVSIDYKLSTAGFAKSSVILAVSALLVSSAVASDSARLYPVANITERAVAADAVSVQGNYNVLVVDTARASDGVTRTANADMVDAASASDSVILRRTTDIVERAAAHETLPSSVSASATLTSRAIARDMLLGFNDIDIMDSAVGHDTVALTTRSSALLVATGLAHDTAIIAGDFADLLIDRALGAAYATAQVEAHSTVTSAAIARDRLIASMATMAWVMNTESFAMARYTSLPFKSMAMVQGRVLGLGDGGLYELAGDTDLGAPVNAFVTTGRSMLGTPAVKRLPAVYITGAVAGQLDLTAIVYGAHKGAFTYSMVAREADAPRGHRIQLGKGLASVYWKFTFANKDGARFDIDTVKADVAPSTTRRI